ncbi:MAG TPA: amidase family protein, partial [Kofleriaceae bacterium]
MAALHELSAHQLASAYATRELSPVEVVRAALARIDAWEPKINAMYRIARDTALAEATASEARWRSGAPLSAIDGVPLTIKENIYTRDDPAPL